MDIPHRERSEDEYRKIWCWSVIGFFELRNLVFRDSDADIPLRTLDMIALRFVERLLFLRIFQDILEGFFPPVVRFLLRILERLRNRNAVQGRCGRCFFLRLMLSVVWCFTVSFVCGAFRGFRLCGGDKGRCPLDPCSLWKGWRNFYMGWRNFYFGLFFIKKILTCIPKGVIISLYKYTSG